MPTTIQNKYNLIEAPTSNFRLRDTTIITYSWSSYSSHGICGHNFEAFELAFQRSNSIFLIPDTLEIANRIIEALYSKYENRFVNELLDTKRIYFGKPKIVTADKIILCDGQMPTNVLLNCENLEMILCGRHFWWLEIGTKKSLLSNFMGKNLTIKFDDRLNYNIESIKRFNFNLDNKYKIEFEHYIKYIDFNLYKKKKSIKHKNRNYLVYATGNCRDLFEADLIYGSNTIQEIKDLIVDRPETNIFFVGLNREKNSEEKIETIKSILKSNVKIVYEDELPVDDLFDLFDTYIYTPTAKNWDCSSRLIPECFYYNKNILFTKTVQENMNVALRVRYQDYTIG